MFFFKQVIGKFFETYTFSFLFRLSLSQLGYIDALLKLQLMYGNYFNYK